MKENPELKTAILAQLFIESMDDIKNSSAIKKKVKYHGNILLKGLKVFNENFDKLYNSDPEMTTNMCNQIDSLVKKISKKEVLDLVMINQIHDHYSENKEDWQNMYHLELEKINT